MHEDAIFRRPTGMALMKPGAPGALTLPSCAQSRGHPAGAVRSCGQGWAPGQHNTEILKGRGESTELIHPCCQ